MMFRYYGIPARYVEGYLITPEDAQSMTAENLMWWMIHRPCLGGVLSGRRRLAAI